MTDIDLDDVVRLAVSAKVWGCLQDLADAVLALAERVRELEAERDRLEIEVSEANAWGWRYEDASA